MQDQLLPFSLVLVLLIAGFSVVARRYLLPLPIIMLAVGVGVSFVPGLPSVSLDPDLVLLLLLPPLLYSSGVGMSWPGFRTNLRPILLLAIGCVLFTALAVAAVAHVIFGLPWAVGFVLGAIVSPPDAVAPMAIARRLGLPHRLSIIIEGEGLVNDATALVILSIALGAVATGGFSLGDAVQRFVLIGVGEVGYGVALGWFVLWLRYKAADPQAELLLALATPFIAFWVPHALNGSGVIACVAAGLYVSWNGPRMIRPATRLQGFFIWGLLIWCIEALVFLLTGLQASRIAEALNASTSARLFGSGILICLTVIVVRFVWVFPATYLPRLIPAIRRRDPAPDWRYPLLISFAGLRGVVSLAAALSIPVSLGGHAFPDRDLVLFTTFLVILITLGGFSAVLPWVIESSGLARSGRAERVQAKQDEQMARIEGVKAALAAIDQAGHDGTVAGHVVSLRRRHSDRHQNLLATADQSTEINPVADASALEFRVVAAERAAIARVYASDHLTDEARRRIERELDLEQARIEHQLQSAGGNDTSFD